MSRVRGLMAVVVSLLFAWVAASCVSAESKVCTPADTVMAAHALECSARVHACNGATECRNAVIKDCDAWGESRCAVDAGADTGAAGAP